MCGRFEQTAPVEKLIERWEIQQSQLDLTPRYNIAPSQDIAVVYEPQGDRVLDALRWGLIPSWAKDPSIGNKMINARAETLVEKPSFRTALKKRRCIVPATGFYEWKGPKGEKQPMNIHLPGRQPFGL